MYLLKDRIAQSKGYPSWDDMENFIIDNNYPASIAQLLVSAMEEVATYDLKNLPSENI